MAIFAARSFDMPLSLSASYCFSFLTFADLLGIGRIASYVDRLRVVVLALLEPEDRFVAVAALFFAVEPPRLEVERDGLRDVPDERAPDVGALARDVAALARDVVDLAFVPTADFARDAVDLARDVVDLAFVPVADFARAAVDFARVPIADFARDVVDLARDVPDVERARDVPDVAREREDVPLDDRFAAVVFPPLLPAAFFCVVEPLRLDVERDELREVPEPPERDRLVPLDLLDLRGVAARAREMVSSSCDCSLSVASSRGLGE